MRETDNGFSPDVYDPRLNDAKPINGPRPRGEGWGGGNVSSIGPFDAVRI